MPAVDGDLILDQNQVIYMMVMLTKLRLNHGMSREQVAEAMGVEKYLITQFDERKMPWETVRVAFIQRYARAVGTKLVLDLVNMPIAEDKDA